MRVLSVKNEGVTIGVVTEALEYKPDLVEVTFVDYIGVAHTVFAHKRGPFQTPEQIVAAWYDGSLHPNPSEPPELQPATDPNTGRGY